MIEGISGVGFQAYEIAFASKEIKSNDNLIVTNSVGSSDSYYVTNNGRLDWANTFTKKRLENRGLEDIENVEPRMVLSRRKWHVEVNKSVSEME